MTRAYLALALVLFALPAFAQRSQSAKPADDSSATAGSEKSGSDKSAAAKSADSKSAEAKPPEPVKNPLPADKSVPQTITVNGKTLHYTATVGTITLKSKDDKLTGVVMYTAFTLDEPKAKDGSHRPVTFALNGGPGASSVYLNLGAIGPKHLAFANEGDSPSDPATLTDNPGTWLDFTDLVFIDPIGTGFSRTLEGVDQTKRDFFSTDNDIHYLSRVIADWLTKNERLRSRKYIAGESYGGYRVPRITHYLQTQLG